MLPLYTAGTARAFRWLAPDAAEGSSDYEPAGSISELPDAIISPLPLSRRVRRASFYIGKFGTSVAMIFTPGGLRARALVDLIMHCSVCGRCLNSLRRARTTPALARRAAVTSFTISLRFPSLSDALLELFFECIPAQFLYGCRTDTLWCSRIDRRS